jgi:hypothetical protein
MAKRIALATKHGKLEQIAPWFESLPEYQLVLAEMNTDVFGTFSGEIARVQSPRETAIAKAIAGAEFLGTEFGLASEGTIGPHLQMPWINSDHEMLALVSRDGELVLVETYLSTEIHAHTEAVLPGVDIDALAKKLDLPNHAAIVTGEIDGEGFVFKGITESSELASVLESVFTSSGTNIKVETDFRAMFSPSRQANISKCAERLVQRIASNCPECNQIGWGRIGFEYGVSCRECQRVVSSVPNSERLGCISCDYSESKSLGVDFVEASRCDYCNP